MSAVQCTVQFLMRHEWSAWDSSASGRGGSRWHERRNQSWGWRVEARSWVGSLEGALECDSVLWQKIVNFSCYVCPINEQWKCRMKCWHPLPAAMPQYHSWKSGWLDCFAATLNLTAVFRWPLPFLIKKEEMHRILLTY